ncbi:hypothetical protein [Lysobacter sp. Root494]|uniref:hypothetical protein n=1 Tax=Lysobacter sp. Root494 TaxID=1736549 RepID=UPI0006F76286|nr:hypothetical protein [Lysobacter sp. Root494]KQY52136.1 hypothetical protein ASD14_05660 [Lysobacter sp. Root494]
MSGDDLLKVLIGVTSAFVGWILAQFTGAAKTWFQRRKIKKLLLEELRDVLLEIDRLLMFYGRQLQIHGAKGIGNSSAAGISNPIFKGYYKDALLSLNQQQRISFQMIHALIDQINSGITEFKAITVDIHDEHFANGMSPKIVKAGKAWADKASAEYQHCASLKWQVEYHLAHQARPDLSPGTGHHESFLIYLDSVKGETRRLIESGKTIDREKFDRAYNPETFRPASP